MPIANPGELLQAWEHGQACLPEQRPVALLSALAARIAREDLERLPLGRRDGQLLQWYEQIFGPVLDCLTECPHCAVQVEFSIPACQLRISASAGDKEAMELISDGYRLSFRLPNSRDLALALAEPDQACIRRRLFAQCLLAVTRADGSAAVADEVPENLVGQVAQSMAEADPQADIILALRCPECAAAWEAPFDIAAFLWQQLHAWAQRFLREVHELAAAYHWSETEILALSSVRRQAYLSLIRT